MGWGEKRVSSPRMGAHCEYSLTYHASEVQPTVTSCSCYPVTIDLNGETPEDQAFGDMVVDSIADFIEGIVRLRREPNAQRQVRNANAFM